MLFLVKLIEVTDTENTNARDDLYANCTHVAKNFWLFEGDEDALHEGISFTVIGEEAIEGTGDLTGSQIKELVAETYGIDSSLLA